ncbi:MAG: acetyl esterase/lipase [Verrucomicrobiales bacterium]|jgi:acetyl esterase/lipase
MRFRILISMALLTLAAGVSAQEKQLLWPDGAPNAKGDADHDQPAMFVYQPDPAAANGCGVVVFPGGGYGGLAADHEGHQIGRFFNEFGVAAFVVHYRLGSKGYHHPTQLHDAQRAIRMVRHNAEKFGVDPERLGTMGFSAGGHLCSMTGTLFDLGQPDAEDEIDRPSSRPDFIIPCYPVISMSTDFGHGGSRRNLLGGNFAPDSDEARAVSTELLVKPNSPPAFIFQTDEDTAVPAENAVLFYLALRKQGIRAEMHIYQDGPHGVGLFQGDPILGTWGGHLKDWMRTNGFLANGERADISGSATLNGTKIGWGSVTFTPEDPNLPRTTARIRGGNFSAKGAQGAIVGKSKVSFAVSIWEATHDPDDNVVVIEGDEVEISADRSEFEFALKAK